MLPVIKNLAAKGGLLLLAVYTTAAAAQVQCSASAQPVTVRAGGLSELLGDILLQCTGGQLPALGSQLPVADIVVTLELNITSRVLSGTATEALLFIDDPSRSSLRPCAPAQGNTVCTPLAALSDGRAGYSQPASVVNVFQGVKRNSNTLVFLGIPIHAPGPGGSRLFRIKNLRAAQPSGFVSASVTIENGSLQVQNNTQVVGFSQQDLSFSVRDAAGTGPLVTTGAGVALSQCTDWNRSLVGNASSDYNQERSFTLRFSEGYPGAFRRRDISSAFGDPPLIQQSDSRYHAGVDPSFYSVATESGFYNAAFPITNGLNRAGRADSGTRLRVVFSNVPATVRVFVSAHSLRRGSYGCVAGRCSDSGDASSADFGAYGVVTDAEGNNQGSATVAVNPQSAAEVWTHAPAPGEDTHTLPLPFSSNLRAGLVEVPVSGGSGTFVWEILGESPFRLETASFAVAFAVSTQSNPGNGAIRVSAGRAFSTAGSAVPISTVNFTVSGCPTQVWFPSPTIVLAGSPAITLEVRGRAFTPQAIVRWNGVDRATTYGDQGTLRIQIAASELARAGTVNITVFEPAAGILGPVIFVIRAPAPTTPQQLSPSNNATGIASGAVLSWTGSEATTYEVYFGQSPIPPLAANVSTPSFAVGSLLASTTYYWKVVSINPEGSAASGTWRFVTAPDTNPTGGLLFKPITPCRMIDTRINGLALAGGETRNIWVNSSPCAPLVGARAYSLNITAIPYEPLGYLTIWRHGAARPPVSTLNSFHGGVVSNAAIVEGSADGSLSVYATHRTELIIDVNGFFEAASGAQFYPLAPCRVGDTRTGSGIGGALGPPNLSGYGWRILPIASGRCGTWQDVAAYALNATVVPHFPLGFLTLSNRSTTNVSTLNSFDGVVVANAAIVASSPLYSPPLFFGGEIYAMATDNTDLILDLNGVFLFAGSSPGLRFKPVTPCRAADTRAEAAGTPIAGGGSRSIQVGGRCGIPSSAKAYSLNVTAVPLGPLGYLTIWPTGNPQPFVSTLNSFLGRVVANAAIIQAGSGGAVSVYVTDPTHVILDINGYFE